MRLTVVVSHPIQYYVPVFQHLNAHVEVDLHVIFLTDSGVTVHHDPGFGREVKWDIPLLEGYQSEILRPGVPVTQLSILERRSALLTDALRRSRPDFIWVFGYASLMNWEAVLFAKMNDIHVIYLSDSNYRKMKRGPKHLAKRLAVGAFFAAVDIFLCSGDANYQYLREFGAKEARIFRSPFSIDTVKFRRTDHHGAPSVDFVWVGKLIPVKRHWDFIEALRMLVSKGLRPTASIVGSGPLEDRLRQESADLIEQGILELTGFVNQSELPRQLHRARVFVFTSEGDQYGLAVTEAVAAGLPIISADINGCVGSWSSAQPGRNALTYRAGNVPALASAMERLLTDRDLYDRLRKGSEQIGPEHDSLVAAQAIVGAMNTTASRGTRSSSQSAGLE